MDGWMDGPPANEWRRLGKADLERAGARGWEARGQLRGSGCSSFTYVHLSGRYPVDLAAADGKAYDVLPRNYTVLVINRISQAETSEWRGFPNPFRLERVLR